MKLLYKTSTNLSYNQMGMKMAKLRYLSHDELPQALREKQIKDFFMSEKDVKERIKNYLKNDGWKELSGEDWRRVFDLVGRPDFYPDVILRKDRTIFCIECKGSSEGLHKVANELKALYDALGKIISKMISHKNWRYAIALPSYFKYNVRKYIPDRVRNLLKLEIFLVDKKRNVKLFGLDSRI